MENIKKNNRLSFLRARYSWPICIISITWILLVAWRPFFFGFYHDDWSSVALPLDRYGSPAELLAGDPTRPLYVLILYAMRMGLADNHFAWQAILAALQLFCALGMSVAVSNIHGGLTQFTNADVRWTGVAAGVLWLVFPWSLGYSAWPVMLPPLLGMLLAIGAIIFATMEGARFHDLAISVFLFVVSWFIYEATWFVWVPIALILLARDFHEGRSLRPSIYYFCLASVAQISFVALNRYLSAQSIHGKKLAETIGPTINSNIHLFKNELIPSLGLGSYFIFGGVLILFICIFSNIKRSGYFLKGFVVLVLFGFGLFFSIVLYAFAGYAIEWSGLFSRVTLPISLWMAFVLSGLFGLGWVNAIKSVKYLSVVGMVSICASLAILLLQQSMPWMKSWAEQQEILRALPQSVVNLADRDSLILMDIPRGAAPVYTFSSFWDISGAITPRISNYAKSKKAHAFAAVLRSSEWGTTWDGKVVRQFWCHSPSILVLELDAIHLYLWKYPGRTAALLTAPYASGCSN